MSIELSNGLAWPQTFLTEIYNKSHGVPRAKKFVPIQGRGDEMEKHCLDGA